MEEGSRVVKRMPSGCRERLRQKPDTRGRQRGPSKASRLQRLILLESETLEEVLAHCHLGAGQAPEVSQVVTDLLDEFNLLI